MRATGKATVSNTLRHTFATIPQDVEGHPLIDTTKKTPTIKIV
jgi:hypothetical protein